jgi:hypothetical protein
VRSDMQRVSSIIEPIAVAVSPGKPASAVTCRDSCGVRCNCPLSLRLRLRVEKVPLVFASLQYLSSKCYCLIQAVFSYTG